MRVCQKNSLSLLALLRNNLNLETYRKFFWQTRKQIENFQKTNVSTIESIIKATVCLHNFLRIHDFQKSNLLYVNPHDVDREGPSGNVINGSWRSLHADALQDVAKVSGNSYTNIVFSIREQFFDYFNTDGDLDWQYKYI